MHAGLGTWFWSSGRVAEAEGLLTVSYLMQQVLGSFLDFLECLRFPIGIIGG